MFTRSFEVRARETDGRKLIFGRPVVYDSSTNLIDFDEIIEKGALDKTDLSDVRFLVNHDISKIPLARLKAGSKNSTMRLAVDEKGLAIEVELDIENNSEARALYSAVQREDISGMSFMFSIDSEEWENLESEHPTRHIKSIGKVIEVSAVTFPAYESTEISARDKNSLDAAKKSISNARLELEKLKAKYLYNF